MIENATGLVLRFYPLTESSLIVHWLTPGFGRIATVAKGARRTKSAFHGKLDLFYTVDFSFSRSRRSELHTLREAAVRDTHGVLRRELGYLQQAAYCAALIEGATETETPLPELFELMQGMLAALALRPPLARTVFAFEIKLLGELGLDPYRGRTGLSETTRLLARRLQEADWPEVMNLSIEAQSLNELKHFLQGFLVYHLGRLPRGREAASDSVMGPGPDQPGRSPA